MNLGKLYMLPMTMGDSSIDSVIPTPTQELLTEMKYLIVENIKTTRRYLKKISRSVDIDSITFFELNKRTDPRDLNNFLVPCTEGHDVGVISEAGCPGIADPGSTVVALAHSKGIDVVPMVGPSSILLSLISSGFNGQKFAFNGYLDREKSKRQKELKHLERLAQGGFTQIFMETPFRNMAMLEDVLNVCNPDTKLCIATDITLPSEMIKTKTIKEWKQKISNINKRPCIFVLG